MVPQSAIDASRAGRMIMHKPETICGTAEWIILQIAYDALQYRVILSTVYWQELKGLFLACQKRTKMHRFNSVKYRRKYPFSAPVSPPHTLWDPHFAVSLFISHSLQAFYLQSVQCERTPLLGHPSMNNFRHEVGARLGAVDVRDIA